MRLNCIRNIGLGLALAAGLSITANAQVTYTWVQTAATTPVIGAPGVPVSDITSSGTITVSGGVVTGTWSDFVNGESTDTINGWAGVTATPQGNGVVLSGLSSGNLFIVWQGTPAYDATVANGGITEAIDNADVFGNWVAVPEPSTMVACALMVLPLGASAVRVLRRKA
jgi:hypothetical protein